jgi:hypothetical protein
MVERILADRQPSPGAGESCGSCRFYLAFPEDDEDDEDDDDGYILEGEADPEDRETGPEEEIELTGLCRRYPPVPLLKGIREFPAVSNTEDWCGEYKPRR